MQKDWPRLLHLLNEELGYSVREGNPAREIQDALVSAVYAFAAPQPQVDDITLMLLSRTVGA